jgi:thiol-disulfide isomerase/thioredoxin
MKRVASLFVLSAGIFCSAAHAQTGNTPSITGIWQGTATARGGAQVPMAVRISGSGVGLKLTLLNGPAAHPEETPASSVSFDGTHLVASYDYVARKLDAALSGSTLTGTFGAAGTGGRGVPTAFTLHHVARLTDPPSAANPADIRGSWEIATMGSKGPIAWEFRVDPPTPGSLVVKTVIQKPSGDTGGLWGTWNGASYVVGHFNATGAALYSVTPQPDGTLLLKSLLGGGGARRGSAETASEGAASADLIARRPEDARRHDQPQLTNSIGHTTVKDPSAPFTFSFPDLSGKTVSNTDAEFRGKVVIVAIGGSWCPNCHDEAPFLVDLYKRFHARGLEIVMLDFEQGDPETDTARLKAFIAHYGLPYPVLTAGSTDELDQKVPQGVNLNYWPTSFILGRDGLVKETHAGFTGPGNTVAHAELVRETTALLEKLLAEPAPVQTSTR